MNFANNKINIIRIFPPGAGTVTPEPSLGTYQHGVGYLAAAKPAQGTSMCVDEQGMWDYEERLICIWRQRRRVVRRIGGAHGDIPAVSAARQQRECPCVLRLDDVRIYSQHHQRVSRIRSHRFGSSNLYEELSPIIVCHIQKI